MINKMNNNDNNDNKIKKTEKSLKKFMSIIERITECILIWYSVFLISIAYRQNPALTLQEKGFVIMGSLLNIVYILGNYLKKQEKRG